MLPCRLAAVMVSVLVSTVIGYSTSFIIMVAVASRLTLLGMMIRIVLPSGIRLTVVNSNRICDGWPKSEVRGKEISLIVMSPLCVFSIGRLVNL